MNRYSKNILKSTLLGQFFLKLKLNSFKRKWVRKNQHNQTIPMNIFDVDTVSVGNHSYGELNVVSFSSDTKLRIGNYVSIAENVRFLLDVEHHLNHISTYPFKVKMLGIADSESFSKGDIVVSDDVWIGYGATILSGVHIGKGAVIAAGSLVVKDVEPYVIVAGVPARVIRKRFSDEIIEKISKLDFELLVNDTVEDNIEYLYMPVTEKTVDEILSSLCKKTHIK